ncbi:hypothetical protein ONR57_11895 [Hoyosella sp. YIM 151337]|uniref:hypothetical protein n=1 Tax=Hoyosella sp. YIM 151337 TaxID=2992742 RepID=UPI00223548AE|nr:hypothetical protein [Hoyosella sp. YIM 151337]MCW4354001.1 hypothetical protein [Hoyosella sp. YIM 151337]
MADEAGEIGRLYRLERFQPAVAALAIAALSACGTPDTHERPGDTPPAATPTPVVSPPPGTICRTETELVVEVTSGGVSCRDAVGLIETYLALPITGEYGQANIRPVGDWDCALTIAISMQEELGYVARCTRGELEVRVPVW